MIRRRLLLLFIAALGALTATTATAVAKPKIHVRPHKRVCAAPAAKHASCHAEVVTDTSGSPLATPGPSGFGPSSLQSAYAVAASAAAKGANQTVAIVDAYDDPKAEADLATYRSTYGLAACTTANGCFRKVNQTGGTTAPRANSGWAQEISLDVDMVSAICPNCHILLVEANSASYTDLGAAVNRAATMGATQISNSYGGSESSAESSYETSYYRHPGIDITVSSGDNGYGTEFPAASQYVTAVGGTSLVQDSSARGWTETAWSGAGSGCSAYIAKPSWQHDTGCAKRSVTDVSAVADPNTGVAVYDTYGSGGAGWMVFGGTSAAAPIVASVDALAGGRAGTAASPTYGRYPYDTPSDFYDVTAGSNGTCGVAYLCAAGTGYDGPTGNGTPKGAGTPPPPAAPVNTSRPAISGTARSGQTLSTTTGTWTGSPAPTYTYQWNRCDTSCLAISGATSGSYTLGSADVGKTLTVTVTAKNDSGAASATSDPSATVTAGPAQAVLNGTFETGSLASWTAAGAIEGVTTGGPHLGTYASLLGAYSTPTNGDSKIAQTFTIPAGTSSLSFWYAVNCPDTVRYDWATATLKDNTTGTTTTPLAKTCNTSNAWTKVSAAVTAGHSYTLTLISHDDNYPGDPTATKFDDVGVN